MSGVDAPVLSFAMDDIAGPSTLIPSASSSRPQQQLQRPKNDKVFLDMLYPIGFSILWMFGLARNLLSYIVSLGIIPLKTASRLFGVDAQQPALRVRSDRKGQLGSQFTSVRVERATDSKRTRSKNREGHDSIGHSWTSHKSAQAASIVSNSSADTLQTNSLPSTPKSRNKALPSLNEPCTDTEQLVRRARTRDGSERHSPRQTKLTHRALLDADVTDVESSAVEKKHNKNRSRIDHTTRRILFIDSKASRRQTAPATSSHVDSPSVASVPTSPVALFESPEQGPSSLPKGVDGSQPVSPSPSPHSQSPSMQNTPSSGNTHPNSFDEFGKRTTTPRVSVDVNRPATAGAESAGESRTEKLRGRIGSNLKIFGRKRSHSISTPSAGVSSPAEASPMPPLMTMPQTPSKLRRKSPFPAKPSRTPKEGGVSASDAEMSSAAAAGSVSWLRSRPKKLTKTSRSRSNSMSNSNITSPMPMPVQEMAAMPVNSPPVIMHYQAGLEQPQQPQQPQSANSDSPSRCPLPRTSTLNSVVSICSTSSPTKSPAANRSRFNPIRNLEAHLYNRHGVGTGPDAFHFVATPIPKDGIKRTNPYELMGGSRPVPSPSSATPTQTQTQTQSSSRTREDDQQSQIHLSAGAAISRRSSAPAGTISPPKTSKSDKRLTRPPSPPRAYTEPK